MLSSTLPNVSVITGKPRLCFDVKHTPALARLYLFSHETKRNGYLGWIFGWALKRFFRVVRRFRVISDAGTLTYQSESSSRDVQFHARNTQFHSVFSPKYAEGYEPETSLLLDAFLADSQVFWDVGSNWGHFALYACSHPLFKGRVHAFEPMPETFHDLKSVVIQSGLGGQITCHNFALGAENGVSTAVLPDGVHSGTAKLGTSSQGTQVVVHAADALSLPDADLIKLDVEGFEAAVLEGARQTIQRSSPMIIMESWLESPDKTLEPLQLLEQMGYQLFHPVWIDSSFGQEYYNTRCPSSTTAINLTLALMPFRAVERLVRSPYMNLFACHVGKLDQLDRMAKIAAAEAALER
jgi:FkbM family methyltransferase